MSSGSFKNVIQKMFTNDVYLIYMYKQDMALNNLQWLICHKTGPTQAKKNNCLMKHISSYDCIF